jgi:hypothetical protein
MYPNQTSLEQIAYAARAGRDFFEQSAPEILDSEIRETFAFIAALKAHLVMDMASLVRIKADDQPVAATPASTLSKVYRDAAAHFDPREVAGCTLALSFAEQQLLGLIKRAFEQNPSMEVRRLLRAYFPRIALSCNALQRLQRRQVAA